MKRLPSGETMGDLPENPRSMDDVPDFISFVGDTGIEGYVKKSDLIPDEPSSPEEAVAQQTERAGEVRALPLYAEDGKTVIGSHTLRNSPPPNASR